MTNPCGISGLVEVARTGLVADRTRRAGTATIAGPIAKKGTLGMFLANPAAILATIALHQ
jgi:hypothetical protein